MKKLMMIFLLAAVAALTTGCIQMHMDTVIEKDGSGTADITMSLSKAVSESLEEIAEADMSEGMDLESLMDLDKSEFEKEIKGHGVKVKKFERGIVDGRETIQISMDFQDLEGLSYAMNEFMDGEDNGMAILDNGDGTYVLKSYQYDWPDDEDDQDDEDDAEESKSPEEMDPEQMQKQMALMGKLMGAMGELEISMKITVPGEIVESNAPTVEGKTSIWRIDSSNMMTAGGDMEPNIVFKAKGLKLKPVKE